jgi:hypothetical protein
VLAVLARGVTDGPDTVADEVDGDTQCQLRGLIKIVVPLTPSRVASSKQRR